MLEKLRYWVCMLIINILLWSKNFTPSVAFNIEFNIFFSGYPLCLDLKKVLYFEKYFKLDI